MYVFGDLFNIKNINLENYLLFGKETLYKIYVQHCLFWGRHLSDAAALHVLILI